MNYQVTFYFLGGGEQKVLWEKKILDPKKSVRELATEWKNDLRADSFKIETIS